MKVITTYMLFLLVVLSITSCQHDDDDTVSSPVVLMYLMADNDISSDIYANIASVEEGLRKSSVPGVFVIYWDGGFNYRNVFPCPTLFKYVVDRKGNVVRTVIQTYSEQNSASPDVIAKVIADTKTLCPSDSYGLIFGSHASGWLPSNASRTYSLGDDNGSSIEIPDLANALEKSGVHFSFILMDACLMSQIEVAYELRYAADYLIVSPAEVLSTGFPYMNMSSYLLASGNLQENMINVAREYIDFYKKQEYQWATIAVINTSELDAFAAATRTLLIDYRHNKEKFTTYKLASMQSNYGYGRFSYGYSSYDIRAFANELTDGAIPQYWEDQLGNVIVFADYVDKYPLVKIDSKVYTGVGCYIPYPMFTKWNDYFNKLQWSKDTGW